MGLIRCKNCNTLISDNNNMCPKCNNIVLKENVEMIYDNEENIKKLDTEVIISENNEEKKYVNENNEKNIVSETFINEKTDENETIDKIKETKKLNIIVNVEIIVIILLSLILLLYFINFISKDKKNKESNKEELKTTLTTTKINIPQTTETTTSTTGTTTTTRTTTTMRITTSTTRTTTSIVTTSTTTKVTTKNNTTTKKKKNIIEATKEPYCEKGEFIYKDFSKTEPYDCYYYVYDKEAIYKKCTSGYTLNAEKNICEKGEDRDIITLNDSSKIPKCSSGEFPYYSTVGGYDCRNGYLYYEFKCPKGYYYKSNTFEGMVFHYCIWNNPYKTASIINSCSKGDYDYETDSCVYFQREPLKYKYSCPNGYELKDTKCVEK